MSKLKVNPSCASVNLPAPFGEDHVIPRSSPSGCGPRRRRCWDCMRAAVRSRGRSAHDRRDAAAGADEEQLLRAPRRGTRKLLRHRPGARELPPGLARLVSMSRVGGTPEFNQLWGDADAAVGPALAARSANRPASGAHHRNHSDPQVLARPVPGHSYPGLISTVAALWVSSSMRSIRPRSSLVNQIGLISSRSSSGSSGVNKGTHRISAFARLGTCGVRDPSRPRRPFLRSGY